MNVLVDDNERAVLCDFGLSRIQEIFTGLTTSSETNIRWMAPERVYEETRKATSESDMYEFGATFWEVSFSIGLAIEYLLTNSKGYRG